MFYLITPKIAHYLGRISERIVSKIWGGAKNESGGLEGLFILLIHSTTSQLARRVPGQEPYDTSEVSSLAVTYGTREVSYNSRGGFSSSLGSHRLRHMRGSKRG